MLAGHVGRVGSGGRVVMLVGVAETYDLKVVIQQVVVNVQV